MQICNRREMLQMLKQAGFQKERNGKGSSEIWKRDNITVSVSLYPKRELCHKVMKLCEV